jgi:hypothetical protein
MTESSIEYTRLHITPFSEALLPSIVPPSVLPSARNISYHTIQTFPEKPYGFIELPTMEASKLKKKLHGSILKGTKIRVESAQPKPDLTPAEPEPEKQMREKRKRKRDEIPGVEIERSVKRGWTTPGLGKKELKEGRKIKSKYTDGKECLFKTVLPANVASKDTSDRKKKRRERETVVHEFAKTEKFATFLRDPAGKKKTKGVAKFVEGEGWVDEDGNVVEKVLLKPKKAPSKPKKAEGKEATTEDSSEDSSLEEEVAKTKSTQAVDEGSATSTSGSSSEEEEEEEEEESDASSKSDSEPQKQLTESLQKLSRPASSGGLTISIPSSAISATPVSGNVHPLEALYKRSTADPTAIPAQSSFSFFGADNDDIEYASEARDTVPLTPFTQKDFEFRGMRSAAPTPDTAHANNKFFWPTDNDDDDDDDERSSPVPVPDEKQKGKAKAKENSEESKEGVSDFSKLFYENRGEMTRAWKKRRKVVAKEKRQRENRKSGNRT